MRAISEQLLKVFAQKWNVSHETVTTIYLIVQDSGRKYGRSSRMLRNLGISLSPRQLKYFYGRIIFYEKFGIENKGKPANYSQLLRDNT